MRRWLALLLLLVLPACAGTETGNPSLAPEGGVVGYEPMGVAPQLAFDEARLAIDAVGFVPLEGCADGAPLEALEAPVVGDLVAATAEPFTLDVPPGDYCAVVLRLAPAAALDGLAIRLDARRTSDGVRLRVEDAAPLELRLTADGSFTLGERDRVLLAIDRSLIEAPLGVSTLAPEPDGVVHVDATRNADRLTMLRDRLASAVTLRRDADGDGALSRDEASAPPLAHGP